VNAVTLNTEMTKDDRFALYPRIGKLWPEASAKLALADNQEQIVEAVSFCQVGVLCFGCCCCWVLLLVVIGFV
jgi:hypothetical protein